jgi:hypothetical protein
LIVSYLNDSAKLGEGARKGDFLMISQIIRLVAISEEMTGNLVHAGIGQQIIFPSILQPTCRVYES